MAGRKALNPAVEAILIFLIAGYIRLVGWTSRLEVRGDEPVWELIREGKSVIFAFWHNRFAIMPYIYTSYFRKKKIAVIVSWSRDGRLVGGLIGSFGFLPISGSSSRGGITALLNLNKCIKDGWSAAVTPDGPRGPRYQVQEGIIAVASTTGAPIVPVSCASTRQLIFRKSWDRFRLPLPFGRITAVFSPPIRVERETTREKRAELAEELRKRIREVDREAEEGKENVEIRKSQPEADLLQRRTSASGGETRNKSEIIN